MGVKTDLAKGITNAAAGNIPGALTDAISAISKLIGGVGGSPLLVDPKRKLEKSVTAPSQILRAAHEVVPFIHEGREDILIDLENFRADDAPFAMRLFTGEGGTGKTRLFIQLGEMLKGTGWQYGFLTVEAGDLSPDAIRHLLKDEKRVFIVIDYAENCKPVLLGLLRQIDAIINGAASKDVRIRLALIARTGGDWWDDLGKKDGALQNYFLRAPAPTPIAPLAKDEAGSACIFNAALKGYGDHLDRGIPNTAKPPPLDATKGNALLIQMAALLALHGKTVKNETEILDGVLEHEDRYWQGKAADAGLGDDMHSPIAQALALATLAGTCTDEKQARALIATAPEMMGDKKGARTIAINLLHELYAQRDWLNGVEPDILGEHLVEREAGKAADLLDAFFATAEGPHAVHGMIVLVRLMTRKPDTVKLIAGILDKHGERLFQHLENAENSGLLWVLENRLPQDTLALREMAERVTRTLLDGIKKMPGEPDLDRQVHTAHLANNLSVRLDALGQHEAALTASNEAVKLYRTLAEQNSDAFAPKLAMSLNNQGTMLSDLGQFDAALAASNEAVALYRTLAAQYLDAFTPDLAMALNNQANRLSDLGQLDAAMTASNEAVTLYHTLAAQNPDAFTPDLAMALNNQANRFGNLGKFDAALIAINEAVALYRDLAAQNPDAFTAQLAISLGAYSNVLEDAKGPIDARDAMAEALAIIKPLFLHLPQAYAHWSRMMITGYLRLCKDTNTEPDPQLIGPILDALQKLGGDDAGGV